VRTSWGVRTTMLSFLRPLPFLFPKACVLKMADADPTC